MRSILDRFARQFLAAAFAAAVLAPSALRAAIIRVPTDVSSVRVAVANAASGDTVQIVGNGGATYVESDILIDKDLTLQGGWRIDFQVRDPDTYVSVIRDTSDLFTSPLFRIRGSPRVVFEGLWLWGGRFGVVAGDGPDLVLRDCVVRGQRTLNSLGDVESNRGGGFRIVGGSALLERCRLHSISIGFSGAAFAAISSASITLRDVQIDNCASTRSAGDASGGAVYVRGVSSFLVERTTFDNCATLQDGGLLFLQATTATLTDSNFTRGLASRHGGAAFLVASSATFDRCTFETNRGIRGGALHAEGGSSFTVRDSRFYLNRAPEQGGACWSSGSTFDVLRTDFELNYLAGSSGGAAAEGGAFYALSSTGQVTDCEFLREKARGKGGAWFQVGGETRFLRTRFEANDAGIFGGGLAIELGGRLLLDRCLLVRNSAKFGGAASASFTGAVEMNRCTVTEGIGRSAGGGVYVDSGGIIRMKDTIACCSVQGEVAYCAGGAITADHCDVWNDDLVNIRAEWGGACADPSGVDGNIEVNPQFCPTDPEARVALGSPCAGAASDGGDLGWLPAGCSSPAPLGVEAQSWGRVKAGWRSP